MKRAVHLTLLLAAKALLLVWVLVATCIAAFVITVRLYDRHLPAPVSYAHRMLGDGKAHQTYASAWLAASPAERNAAVFSELYTIFILSKDGSAPESCAQQMLAADADDLAAAVTAVVQEDLAHGRSSDPYVILGQAVNTCVKGSSPGV